jgi:hypothetical protein
MAKASVEVLTILRNTITKLENSNHYQWGHMGLCNCGFLAQEITKLKKEEIHSAAMQQKGDWSEQLNDYCPTSGLPMDDLISEMLDAGFDSADLKHLERLSSPTVLHSLPLQERDLKHNVKAHVIKYLKAWTILIESQLLEVIRLPEIHGADVHR